MSMSEGRGEGDNKLINLTNQHFTEALSFNSILGKAN